MRETKTFKTFFPGFFSLNVLQLITFREPKHLRKNRSNVSLPISLLFNTYHFTCYETNREIVSHGIPTRPELYILYVKAVNILSKTDFEVEM